MTSFFHKKVITVRKGQTVKEAIGARILNESIVKDKDQKLNLDNPKDSIAYKPGVDVGES